MPLLNVPKPKITRLKAKTDNRHWFKCTGKHGITGWGFSPEVAYGHWKASMEGRVYRHHEHEPELCRANYRRKYWKHWKHWHVNPKE